MWQLHEPTHHVLLFKSSQSQARIQKRNDTLFEQRAIRGRYFDPEKLVPSLQGSELYKGLLILNTVIFHIRIINYN